MFSVKHLDFTAEYLRRLNFNSILSKSMILKDILFTIGKEPLTISNLYKLLSIHTWDYRDMRIRTILAALWHNHNDNHPPTTITLPKG